MASTISSRKGALPSQTIQELITAGFILGAKKTNVGPASLDLSLSDEAYIVEGIFQPREGERVRDVLNQINRKAHSLSLPMQRDRMYLVRVNETLALPTSVYAYCNPKSSSGRLDVHVRLIADGIERYDSITAGWKGELWISIMPKSFSVKLSVEERLNQLRFFNDDTALDNLQLEIAIKQYKILWQQDTLSPMDYEEVSLKDNDASIILTLDLSGEVLGYECVFSKEIIDVKKIGAYPAVKFFKPLSRKGGYLYLKKGNFYILSTYEAVRVPPELACEMLPMDERSGEFRAHYAGFIDPGWGWGKRGEGKGRPLTLEVRPFEDLIVRHGQPIAKIRFEKMTQIPKVSYDSMPSNYLQQSGPRLSKQFKVV